MANIVIIEPFGGGSHLQWAQGWQKHSQHTIKVLSLSAHHWKWRMHGGAITLAQAFLQLKETPDWIVASDMLDLTTFLSLCRAKLTQTKVAVYFHENQLTYPWSPTDQDKQNRRDNHYKFINYTSALAADRCLFNSHYHKNSFLEALPTFLRQFPDHRNTETITSIKEKSQVLPLGLDLQRLDISPKPAVVNKPPILLWNHRWEYDKNPTDFFEALFALQEVGLAFRLIVLGQQLRKSPPIFQKAKKRLAKEIIHWGYCESRTEYAQWLWQADILPVTSKQDFFGGSIIEAVYCNTLPLLPQRLAYPEHFPQQAAFFYQNQVDFLPQLKQLLQHATTKETQPLVQKYDWEALRTDYDVVFA